MSHHDHDHDPEDDAWSADGATEMFNGYKVWDHGVWPNDMNHVNQEPETE
jgi:hypothetical protein